MKRICAWCRNEIGSVDGGNGCDDDVISHGICRSCADNIAFQQGVKLPVYIESLDLPVVVVNKRGAVQALNAKAREVFRNDKRQDEGQELTGEVFECQYARLPEGCGRTIHCSGCAIRRSIEKTLATGEPQCSVPATLRRKDPDHPTAIAFSITTVKSGDAVLLRLELGGKRTPES